MKTKLTQLLIALAFALPLTSCAAVNWTNYPVGVPAGGDTFLFAHGNTNNQVAATNILADIAAADTTHPFDTAGAAQAATNNASIVRTNNTTWFDAKGAATAVTNGYPWGSLYDSANAAHNATNGYPWGSLYQPALTYQPATNGGPIATSQITSPPWAGTNGIVSQVKSSFTTNYPCTTNDTALFCTGTNQLITLPDCTATPTGKLFDISAATTTGSVLVTNATGAQTILGALSISVPATNHLTVINSGTAWW